MPSETKSVRERVEEALREIGVLLLAFGPLDSAVTVAQGGQRPGLILIFVGLGLCFFTGSLAMERRRSQG